jgi:hypothetical protein
METTLRCGKMSQVHKITHVWKPEMSVYLLQYIFNLVHDLALTRMNRVPYSIAHVTVSPVQWLHTGALSFPWCAAILCGQLSYTVNFK